VGWNFSRLSLVLSLVILAWVTAAQQDPRSPAEFHGTVDVRLKLPDGEKFSGVATIRLLRTESPEVVANTEDIGGWVNFIDVGAGSYIVEVIAPGFVTAKQILEITARQLSVTVFMTMTPESSQTAAVFDLSPPVPTLSTTTREDAEKAIQALSQNDFAPSVVSNVACPLPLVLKGVGERVEEFVNNLDRFSATEQVEHFAVRADGELRGPEARSFEYVVVVSRTANGGFGIDEYRSGSIAPTSFPAGIATMGIPALALILHPGLTSGFNLGCEGLGEFGGRPAWIVHFEQRLDRPNHIRRYFVGKNSYAVPLKGLVMIDAGTFQVLRLESELIKPVPQVKLTQEHISIDYALVQFRIDEQQLWLPKTAEIYVEGKRRYYRRFTFSNFKIFSVATDQKVHVPKQSYAFTNNSDHEISAVLTVSPIPGQALHQVSITFRIPARSTVFKFVGPGKDVNLPAEAVESARFVHTGPAGSIDANAYFVKASLLELVPETVVPADQTN
jgi:hypothetical protein